MPFNAVHRPQTFVKLGPTMCSPQPRIVGYDQLFPCGSDVDLGLGGVHRCTDPDIWGRLGSTGVGPWREGPGQLK